MQKEKALFNTIYDLEVSNTEDYKNQTCILLFQIHLYSEWKPLIFKIQQKCLLASSYCWLPFQLPILVWVWNNPKVSCSLCIHRASAVPHAQPPLLQPAAFHQGLQLKSSYHLGKKTKVTTISIMKLWTPLCIVNKTLGFLQCLRTLSFTYTQWKHFCWSFLQR